MIIACPACATRYVVPESAIGVDGRTVRCAKCKHSWFQEPALPGPATDKATAAGSATSASPAPPAPAPPEPEPEPGAGPEPVPAPPPTAAAETAPGVSSPPPGPAIDHWRSEDARAAAASPPGSGEAISEPEEATAPFASKQDQPEDDERGSDHDADAPYMGEPASAFDEDAYPGEDAEADPYDEEESRFDYRPPFTRRRNALRMWTIAAALFAALALGTAVAVNHFGLPAWLPIERPTFGIGKADLELDFPAGEQRKEVLDSGEEIFRVRGSVSNTGASAVSVPSLLVVFRDARERNVYSWEVVPEKRELAPGESLNVTEAITDIPAGAQAAEIGWSPS
ncbi:zinc-ribbon domain-containing protein [Erythrobacter sp.]|uniref:zinc-ribbon domain-containing protein n=1 Tax=Erythrobacter sp. TaxID=1042 RepID=UPI002EC4CD84|nr:zinc-ribbon domain-containing protein [Erythrobacter sp.]